MFSFPGVGGESPKGDHLYSDGEREREERGEGEGKDIFPGVGGEDRVGVQSYTQFSGL